MREHRFPNEFIRLPNRGPNSIYLTAQGIMTKDELQPGMNKTKSLDFYEEIGEIIYYYYHKHTRHGGGSQTNQHNDMVHFIQLANEYCQSHNDNARFVGVIDGAYYTNNIRNEIENFAVNFLNSRVYILTWREVLQAIN